MLSQSENFVVTWARKKTQSTSRESSVSTSPTPDFAIRRFEKLGHADCVREAAGPQRSIESASDEIQASQQEKPLETGIPSEAVWQKVKVGLKLPPYKLQKGQLLTNKYVLLQRYLHRNLLWTMNASFSPTTSCLPSSKPTIIRRTEAGFPKLPILAIVERRQNPLSAIVWDEICANDKASLGFVDEGMKINQEQYRRDILEVMVSLEHSYTSADSRVWSESFHV